ncbi:MAG: tetratricopeptide repeat protein [Simkaniaceae bacterium]|jgi:tetratricopeptide (TPR) repeat protein|nr:MAG: tetratricopeptide repeat protein [Simkaniaceae bacterium]
MAAIGSSNNHFLTIGGFTKIGLDKLTQTEDGKKVRLYLLKNPTEEKIKKAKEAILKEVSQKNREYVGDLVDFDIDIQEEPYLLKEGKTLFLLSEKEASGMLKNYSLALQKRSVLLGLASGFSLEASNLFSTGQYEKALETYFKCLETVRGARDKEREAGTLYNIGEVFAKLNQHEEAISYYLECLNIVGVIETNESFVELAYRGLGIAYTFLGDTDAAKTYYQKYFDVSEHNG